MKYLTDLMNYVCINSFELLYAELYAVTPCCFKHIILREEYNCFVALLVCGEHTSIVVLWQPSHHPTSKWMLHTGSGWGETPPPHMIVKRFGFGCTTIHNKVQYKCILNSFKRISKFVSAEKEKRMWKLFAVLCDRDHLTSRPWLPTHTKLRQRDDILYAN